MPMQFKRTRPDAVRAINQRWLLKFWTQHREGAYVPRWQAIKPDDLDSLSDNLSLLDVTGDTPPRFRIRFQGRMVARVYGSVDNRGRYLDEWVRPERLYIGLASYTECARTGLPVYTIQDIYDSAGRLIHYERLLLPFACDGETVDRILAALEFICADGNFDAQALLSAPGSARTLRLAATIEIEAGA